MRSCERSNTAHSNCAVKHGCTGCNCPMPQGPKPGQGGAPHTPTTLFPPKTEEGRPCVGEHAQPHLNPRAKQSNVKKRRGNQSKAKHKHKQSKSNSDATRVTCYPRARVLHVTLGHGCHLLLRATQGKANQIGRREIGNMGTREKRSAATRENEKTIRVQTECAT